MSKVRRHLTSEVYIWTGNLGKLYYAIEALSQQQSITKQTTKKCYTNNSRQNNRNCKRTNSWNLMNLFLTSVTPDRTRRNFIWTERAQLGVHSIRNTSDVKMMWESIFVCFTNKSKTKGQRFSYDSWTILIWKLIWGEHFAFCFSFPLLCFAAELIYAWRWLYIPWQRQHFYGCPFAHLFGYGLLDSEIQRDICS